MIKDLTLNHSLMYGFESLELELDSGEKKFLHKEDLYELVEVRLQAKNYGSSCLESVKVGKTVIKVGETYGKRKVKMIKDKDTVHREDEFGTGCCTSETLIRHMKSCEKGL